MTSVTPPVISAVGGNFQVTEMVDNKQVTNTLSFASLLIRFGLKSMESSRAAFSTQYTIASDKVKIMQELNNLMQLVNNFKAKFTDKDGKDTKKMMDLDLSKQLAAFMKKYPGLLTFTEMTALGGLSEAEGKTLLNTLNTRQTTKKSEKDAAYNQLSKSEKAYVDTSPAFRTMMKEPTSDAYKKWEALDTECTTIKNSIDELTKKTKEGGEVTLSEETAKYLKDNSIYTLGTKYEITKENVNILTSQMQTAQSTLSSENEQQSMRTNQAMNRSSGFLQQLQGLMQSAKEALQAASKAGAA